MLKNSTKSKTCIHTYAMLLMGEQGKSQTSLAAAAGVTLTTVNQILLGKRTSAAVQHVIAQELGFNDWAHLADASDRFSDLFKNMYNRPTQRPTKQEASDVDKRQGVI